MKTEDEELKRSRKTKLVFIEGFDLALENLMQKMQKKQEKIIE